MPCTSTSLARNVLIRMYCRRCAPIQSNHRDSGRCPLADQRVWMAFGQSSRFSLSPRPSGFWDLMFGILLVLGSWSLELENGWAVREQPVHAFIR